MKRRTPTGFKDREAEEEPKRKNQFNSLSSIPNEYHNPTPPSPLIILSYTLCNTNTIPAVARGGRQDERHPQACCCLSLFRSHSSPQGNNAAPPFFSRALSSLSKQSNPRVGTSTPNLPEKGVAASRSHHSRPSPKNNKKERFPPCSICRKKQETRPHRPPSLPLSSMSPK